MSRRFCIVKPEDLWTGPTTRELRKHAADVRELLAYLLSGPTSDRWGIWHLELDTVVLHTGRKDAVVLKGFDVLAELGLAHYDLGSQFVYVPHMPESQFAQWPLMPKDNNARHAKRWYKALPRNPFLGSWFDRHVKELFLTEDPEPCERREWIPREGEAPLKGPALEPAGLVPATDLLGERNLPAKRDRRAGAMTSGEIDSAYDKIVSIYPKPDALEKGRKAFHKLKPTPELVGQIFAALQWQVVQPDWLKEGAQFAPSLYRYFEGKRWLDRPRRVPHVSESTMSLASSGQGFVNQFPEDERCERPAPRPPVSGTPSSKLHSLPPSARSRTR